MYQKPFLEIPDQVALLESRGLVVGDHDRASEYLRRIGYYRLSAYWHPLRKRDSQSGIVLDDFVDGSAFEAVTDLYTFDGRLRLIVLDALERLEVSLRTQVALALGRHDPLAHRKKAYLDGKFTTASTGQSKSNHQKWLAKLDERAQSSKDKFAEHFRTKYPNDHMPVWIAVELLDFGPLSYLINGLRFKDKKVICADYPGVPPEHLGNWVRTLSFTRNVCAHHSRLWNKPLISQPSLHSSSAPDELAHLRTVPGTNTRLYAAACIIQFMLRHVNPRTSWRDRFIRQINSFPSSDHLQLSSAGFPDDWKANAIWK